MDLDFVSPFTTSILSVTDLLLFLTNKFFFIYIFPTKPNSNQNISALYTADIEIDEAEINLAVVSQSNHKVFHL